MRIVAPDPSDQALDRGIEVENHAARMGIADHALQPEERRDAQSALERPQLRPHLAAAPEGRGGYVIWDQLRLADRRLRVTTLEMKLLSLFDGRRTLRDIQAESMLHIDGPIVPLEIFSRLVHQLDDALFLEGPRFRSRLREHTDNPIRPPLCLGSYGDDPVRLRHGLEQLFTGPNGPGRPGPRSARRALSRRPHPAHRLRARRHYLRLGIQGTLRAHLGQAVRHHWHLALQLSIVSR